MFESPEAIRQDSKYCRNKKSSRVKKTRRLKIQYGTYAGRYRRFPVIRLAGHWLRAFDFQIGDFIELHTEKGVLRITTVSQMPQKK